MTDRVGERLNWEKGEIIGQKKGSEWKYVLIDVVKEKRW